MNGLPAGQILSGQVQETQQVTRLDQRFDTITAGLIAMRAAMDARTERLLASAAAEDSAP